MTVELRGEGRFSFDSHERRTTLTKQPDCTYRWTYELNMYRNPTVLITVLKVLGLSMGLIWLFVVLVSMGDRRFWWDGCLIVVR